MTAFSDKSLIITNLDPRVTEEALKEIFSLFSPIVQIKITKDNSNNHDLNCGLVECHDHQAAKQAIHAMDKRTIYSQEITVKFKDQVNTSNENQVFITDLDHTITDAELWDVFRKFHVRNARVIKNSARGVVTFENKSDADDAIRQMEGALVGSSRVHCRRHWHKTSPLENSDQRHASTDNSDAAAAAVVSSLSNMMSYEDIFAQTPLYNTSVSIRGLPKHAVSQDVAPHLQQYGFVTDIYIKRGKAVVKLDTHANAATAIFALQGITIAGNTVDLDWVKDQHVQRTDNSSQEDTMARSYNVFYSGYVPPSTLVNQITNTYENHTTMRPPAPTTDPAGGEPGGGIHGWNQYYQQYYSAGHLTI